MGRGREWFGIYGPDVALFGVVVIVAAVVASAFAFISAMQATGGVAGWVVVRILPQVRDRGGQALRNLSTAVARSVLAPALGWLSRGPVLTVVKAGGAILAVVGLVVLAYVVWKSTDSHPVLLAGLTLITVGLLGHYSWFRQRVTEWNLANA